MNSEIPFIANAPDWEVTTLGELCQRGDGDIQTGPFGTQLHAADYVDDGVPSIMPQDLVDGRIDTSAIARIREKDAVRLGRYRVRVGDIVYSRRGDIKRRALIANKQHGWLCGTGCLRVRVADSANPRFVNAYLGHPAVQGWIERHSVGATMPNLNTSILAAVPVLLPGLDEQNLISSVLGALDHKIDSNRRLAGLLEAAATTLFRARFVDFVGVDEFEGNEIERVPLGWSVATLGEIAKVHRDLVRGIDGSPYIGLDAMPRQSTVLTDWIIDDAPAGQAARFAVGDVLFGKLRPYFHKVGVAPTEGRCSTEILVLRPSAPELYGIVLGHAASAAFIAHCVAVSRGTKMPRAEWKDAGSFAIAIPPHDEAAEFTAFARCVYAQIRALILESRTLACLRGALLPKLISGEIRVPDAADLAEVIEPAAAA